MTRVWLLYTKWVKDFVFIILFLIGILAGINYIVNPYGIFEHDTWLNEKKNFILSDRISRIYELKKIKPNVIMMGTSRMNQYKEYQLEKYFNGVIYNASLGGSNIFEQVEYLKYIVNNYDIKAIVWSLDFFNFNPEKGNHKSFEIKRLEKKLYIEDYYVSLFSFTTLKNSILTLKDNLHIKEVVYIDQPYNLEQVQKNIRYTTEQYKNDKSFLKSDLFKNKYSIEERVKLIAQIKQLCDEKNIKLYVYTSIVHKNHIDMIYDIGLSDTFEYWKYLLSKEINYFDFCNYNSISTNEMNFRDGAHSIRSVGDLIFKRMFTDFEIDGQDNFGIYSNFVNER